MLQIIYFLIIYNQKSLIASAELCAHEYEYVSHIVAHYNFYTQRPYGIKPCGRLLSIPPAEKKGDD